MADQNHNQTATGESTEDRVRQVGRARNRRRRVRTWILGAKLLADASGYSIAWIGAWGTRVQLTSILGKELNPPEVYWRSLPFIVIGSLLVAAAVGSYTLRQVKSPLNDTIRIFKSAFGSLLVVMSVGFLVKEFDYSRTVVMLFGLYSLLSLPVARVFSGMFEQRLVKLGLLGTRVIIVGAGEMGVRALQRLQDHPEIGYRIVGFLDDDPEKLGTRIGRTPVLAKIDRLKEIVGDEKIDEVVIAMPLLGQARLMELVMSIDDLPIRIHVVADLFGVLNRETQIDAIEDVPIYELKGPDMSTWYRLSKRLFDLVSGGLASLIFVITFPVIACAIKLENKGAVFFVHDRIGLEGKKFRMWKYRTMRTDAEAYSVAPKEEGDPRVTKVGLFLRKTSLDELPQVLNVLRGEMSIVGPRPEMPFIVETYNDWQRKRLEVKPGITGLWQILGRKDLPLHENLEYDFYYIKNRSLLLDIVIVFKTVTTVLSGKGAY